MKSQFAYTPSELAAGAFGCVTLMLLTVVAAAVVGLIFGVFLKVLEEVSR